jgi:hypothetical protein
LFQNIVKRKKKMGAAVWETLVWEQHPQIEDALPAPPIQECRRSSRRLFGNAGGDALMLLFRFFVELSASWCEAVISQ